MGIKERLLGVGNQEKLATLVIYWADTQQLLTHMERTVLSNHTTTVVDMTPLEVLLQDTVTGRKVVVRGINDAGLPKWLLGHEDEG